MDIDSSQFDHDPQLARFQELWERHLHGEITAEQVQDLMVDEIFPDEPERAARMREILATMDESGMGTAIETAIRLPGINIPVGKPGEN